MEFTISTLGFLIITLIMFYLSDERYRGLVLTVASLIYIGLLNFTALEVLLVQAVAVYCVGYAVYKLKYHGIKASVIVAAVGIVTCVASLGIFKFSGIALPIGFSYYIFQSISFLADIQSGKLSEFPNPVEFLLYQSLFAKFVSGPIERADQFISQKENYKKCRFFDEANLNLCAGYIIYGYFLKLILANRFAQYTTVLLGNPDFHSRTALAVGSLMYTLQIYTDFAGYSAMAIGFAGLFGIRLTQNFRAPYTASGMSDFWRRWHISLSKWLRDYIYIPLGGNRKGDFRKHLNTMIVFVVCGLWHGNGMNFLAWGLIHGVLSVVDNLLQKLGVWESRVMKVVRWILTFCSVSLAWIFFGSSSFSSACAYLKNMFLGGGAGNSWAEEMELLGMTDYQIWIMVIAVLVMIVMDVMSSRADKDIPAIFMEKALPVRLFIFYLMIVLTLVYGVYGPESSVTGFMYMDF